MITLQALLGNTKFKSLLVLAAFMGTQSTPPAAVPHANSIDTEKAELADIFDATFCRSQDIQFVIRKLMPTKDSTPRTALQIKEFSRAIYRALNADGVMDGSMGETGDENPSSYKHLITSALDEDHPSFGRKRTPTETEAVMLCKMIRGLGRQVSLDFHEYKKNLSQIGRARTDYANIQKNLANSHATQGSEFQKEMEYDLRKQRREIDGLYEDARRSRAALVTLAGTEAVNKLDKQIILEEESVERPLVTPDELQRQ